VRPSPRLPVPFLFVLALAFVAVARTAGADPEPRPALDAAGIRAGLERLQVMGSALYVAAHPDDENTAFLAYLANGRKVETAYLSLTRGDGGQNLIGPDTGTLLGVIRTQELVAARRIDGAEQFFTRALDFGFSKNPEETLEIWGRDRILSDVVWVIRSYRPDIIVTRFPTDGSGGHGHHTASAILAEEAFAAAADSTRFPEQLQFVRPWQAKRLVWNVFRFGGQAADTVQGRVRVDVGAYDALLGRSYTEIAGASRSQHKSQGFGSAERRGKFVNSFEPRLGERATADLFDGVDLTWARVRGGQKVAPLLAKAAKDFDPAHPAAIVPTLARARTALADVPDDPLVRRKRAELDQLLRACLGLWLEAIAQTPSASPGATVKVVTSALARNDAQVVVQSVAIADLARSTAPERALAVNEARTDTLALSVPRDAVPTRPYWLAERPREGSFEVTDQRLIGKPENDPVFVARFSVLAAGVPLTFDTPVVYRWTDPVRGERYRDFLIVPSVTLRLDEAAYLFPDAGARPVTVTVQSAAQPVTGSVRLALPAGWRATPNEFAVALAGGEIDTTVSFSVTPPAGDAPLADRVAATFESGGAATSVRAVRLDYTHIPLQALVLPAEARLVRADVRHTGARVAYVMGSGDAIPDALTQMGYAVTLLSDDDVEHAALVGYDAIVIGVRAYNTRPRLRRLQGRLLDYVAQGGRLILQYDTADEALDDRLGPYPFKISRDRVTVETAPVRVTLPGHPLLTTPNRIGDADFEGWVQERGLYFANPIDPRYETPLSSNDPGETPKAGGLLYARHGKGVFVYAAYAWFRQLPGGVPGAYRIFANLVSPDVKAGPRL